MAKRRAIQTYDVGQSFSIPERRGRANRLVREPRSTNRGGSLAGVTNLARSRTAAQRRLMWNTGQTELAVGAGFGAENLSDAQSRGR